MITLESNTYTQTKAQYTAWSAETALKELSDSLTTEATAVLNTSEADPFFNFFSCGGSRDFKYTCYKYMPAVTASGVLRFDPDTTGCFAMRFLTSNDIGASGGVGTYTEEAVTFTGALAGASATLALVSGILAISFN